MAQSGRGRRDGGHSAAATTCASTTPCCPAPSQTDLTTGRGRAQGRRAINLSFAVAPGSQFRSTAAIRQPRSVPTTALLLALESEWYLACLLTAEGLWQRSSPRLRRRFAHLCRFGWFRLRCAPRHWHRRSPGQRSRADTRRAVRATDPLAVASCRLRHGI